uniref:Uncharacterized protein n=1 Tax=Rhizophora mucronata TaxID=61149 RepID=A0A2P2KBA9_RHIMU
MDIEQEGLKPLSPTGQWTSSSFLSLFVIGVLESQVPIDDTQIMPLIPNVFLPINTRFSSIMVMDEKGVKQWKKVEVRLKDHINVPIFTPDRSTEYYDERLDAYLSKLATEQLPQSRPPWEIHIIKYPTSHAAGNIIFKLHHSLGDGFSLMGALLSCLQRVDNPSLPLTFPSSQLHLQKDGQNSGIGKSVVKLLSSAYYTVFGFWSSVIKSNLVEDDKSPIRSGNHGVESLPVSIVTMSFSLDDIKQIKAKLSATVNDVITGTIFLGTRLYMEEVSQGSGKADTTALVLLNTRMFRGYKSVQEMLKPDAEFPWGNQFAFLIVPVPKLSDAHGVKNPVQFVWNAQTIIQQQRSSLAVYLTAKYLQLVHKFRGPEVASSYMYSTLRNSSIGISNVVGPIEQMALANHPIKGLYFGVAGSPQVRLTNWHQLIYLFPIPRIILYIFFSFGLF